MPSHPTAKEVAQREAKKLRGRWAVVTGSTSGIGLETARALLSAGCNVVIAGRNKATAQQIAEELMASCTDFASDCPGPGTTIVEELDLADLQSVKRFSAAVISRLPQIDILICNAGVMATPFGHTVDGLETQLGTNHVGHQALVQLLLPTMPAQEKSGSIPGRVVILTSVSHKWAPLELSNLHFKEGRRYNRWVAYAQSKLACLLMAKELASRLRTEGSNIKVVAVHPGIIFTNITRHRGPSCMTPVVHFLLNPLSKTPAQGAATTVWAAVADVPSGSYCGDCAVAKAGGKGNDAALAHALFAATEETIHTALAARAKADNASTIPAAVGAPGVEVVVRDSSSKE